MPARIQQLAEQVHSYQVTDFSDIGVDSYSLAPNQPQDTYELLTNVQPVTRRVIERRWGYGLFNNPSLAARRFYEYQNDTTGVRRLVLTASTGVEALTEAGGAWNTGIFTPSGGAGHPRMVNSRDYAYFVDGVAADAKKWDGSASGGTSKWGIERPGYTYNSSTAATSPATASGWTNSNNCFASDNTYATDTTVVAPGGRTAELLATNYSFAIPNDAVIKGIKVEVEAKVDNNADGAVTHRVYLRKNGANTTDTEDSSTALTTTDAYISFGGSTSLWNETWTPAEINASTFGISYSINLDSTSSSPVTFSVDHVRLTIYYTTPIQLSASVAGSVTLTFGRKYTYCYRNSTTGHCSGLAPFSASTGVITTDDQPLTNITASTDTQVDRKLVLATADGGDTSKLYLLADLPNATTTLTDNVTEAVLLTRPVFQSVDDLGLEHGVADNDPPPNISLPTKHLGRIYGSYGQLLYFSKSIAELTTSDGTIVGKYEESWPSDYYLDISEGAETIRAILSDGATLYLGTDRHVRRLLGDGPDNFQTPEILFNEVGVLNQEVWKLCFLEGQPVGTIWLTPDFRVIGSDFTAYQDIGHPVQDVLDSINTTHSSKCHATYVGDGGLDLYVLAVPTNANTEPDTLLVYNLKSKKWFVWDLADNVTAMLYNINASGVPQFLFVADTGKVYQFSSSHARDRISDTPTDITITIQTPWLDLGDPSATKTLNRLEVSTQDANMLVSVYGANSGVQFASPTTIKNGVAVTSYFNNYKVFLAGSVTNYRFYKFKFVSANSGVSRILDSFMLEYARMHHL